MSEPSNNSNSNMGMKKWLTAGSMLLPRWTQSMEGWQTHLSTRGGMMMELMWRAAEITDGGDIVISRLFPSGGNDKPVRAHEAGAFEVLHGLLIVSVYGGLYDNAFMQFTLGKHAVFEFEKDAWFSIAAEGRPTLMASYTHGGVANYIREVGEPRPLDGMSAAILLEDARVAVNPLDALSQAAIS